MISRNDCPSAYVGVICGQIPLILAFLGQGTFGREAAAQPTQFVRWELEATVIELIDPSGLFPDVRLGDPVRGVLQYYLDDVPILVEEYFASYYQPEYGVATMVVENPRTGNDVVFAKDLAAFLAWADVDVVNDHPTEGGDGVFFVQSVLKPAGFMGIDPVLEVDLVGPPDILADLSLPPELDLNDWPIATIAFYDFAEVDPTGTTIVAEIYSLTPAPILPGDFDSDDDVDADDYSYWHATFGSDFDLSADANGNGIVDAADYTVWRNNLGQSPGSGSSISGTVPEPATLSLVALALIGLAPCARRPRGTVDRWQPIHELQGRDTTSKAPV